MNPIPRPSLVEATAGQLRRCIQEGRWQGWLPGVRPLAEEFMVSKETLRAALAILEKERILAPGNAGRLRQILTPGRSTPAGKQHLRVALLLRHPLQQLNALSQGHMLALLHEIRQAGHQAFVAKRHPKAPGKDGAVLRRLVEETQADAWILYSAGHEALAWFAQQKLPVFALGGHPLTLDIPWACSDLTNAIQDALADLVAHGHRRIVLITSEKWLKPTPNTAALVFAKGMQAHGLSVTDYNLPNWVESSEGLEALLKGLFSATPPTALIVFAPSWTVATLGWLLRQGLRVPEDVSLISILPDPALSFWNPPVAHFQWLTAPHIHHALKWLRTLVEGKKTPGARPVAVTYVRGGTVGLARADRPAVHKTSRHGRLTGT